MRVHDKNEFKISMLDDDPDSLSKELDEIELYLHKKYELRLGLIKYEDESEILDELDNSTDIAFIDKNLSDNRSGVEVVKKIREKHALLDVFVYSRDKIGVDELAKLAPYGSVEVAQEPEQIVDRLKTLIDKNLSKWNDIVFLRGVVISRIIDLERDINDLLMVVFPQNDEKRKKDFRDLFLENSYVSLEAKKQILKKLPIPFNSNRLQKLQKARNLLAHCKRSKDDPNVLVKMGEEHEFDSNEIKKIFARAESISRDIRQLQEKYQVSTGE